MFAQSEKHRCVVAQPKSSDTPSCRQMLAIMLEERELARLRDAAPQISDTAPRLLINSTPCRRERASSSQPLHVFLLLERVASMEAEERFLKHSFTHRFSFCC